MSSILRKLSGTKKRILNEEDGKRVARSLSALFKREEDFRVALQSAWECNTKWGRNRVLYNSDHSRSNISLSNRIRGASASLSFNQIDDKGLDAAVKRIERLMEFSADNPEFALNELWMEPYSRPQLWFDSSYNLKGEKRTEIARSASERAEKEGLVSAGFISVKASGYSLIDSDGLSLYYPYTQAQCSITVRTKDGRASGWAGVDFGDWNRINTDELINTAISKCLSSQNPSVLEPGRYTVILEPQAVCDLFAPVIEHAMDRAVAERTGSRAPFSNGNGFSRIGERVIDPRITVTADPMDPDLGFLPFRSFFEVYHPVTWIENGVLKELSYDRNYGINQLGHNTGLANSRAFRISGGSTSVDEMISQTSRGFLITRFSNLAVVDSHSMLMTGYTRDGIWLIENGKITRPVANFRFTESPLFAFNNIEQIGISRRVFRPSAPAITPYLKIKDFSFTGITRAV